MDRFVVRKSVSGDDSSHASNTVTASKFAVPLSSHIENFLFAKKVAKPKVTPSSSAAAQAKGAVPAGTGRVSVIKPLKNGIVVKSRSTVPKCAASSSSFATPAATAAESMAKENNHNSLNRTTLSVSRAAQNLVRSHKDCLERENAREALRKKVTITQSSCVTEAVTGVSDNTDDVSVPDMHSSSRYEAAVHLSISKPTFDSAVCKAMQVDDDASAAVVTTATTVATTTCTTIRQDDDDDDDFMDDIMSFTYRGGGRSSVPKATTTTGGVGSGGADKAESCSVSNTGDTSAYDLKIAMQLRPLDVLSRMDTTYRAASNNTGADDGADDGDGADGDTSVIIVSDTFSSTSTTGVGSAGACSAGSSTGAPVTVSDYFERHVVTREANNEGMATTTATTDTAKYSTSTAVVDSLVALRQQSLLEHMTSIQQQSNAVSTGARHVPEARQMSHFVCHPENLLHPTLAVNQAYCHSNSQYSCNGNAGVNPELKRDHIIASRLSFASNFQLHSTYTRSIPRPARLSAAELHQYEELAIMLRKSGTIGSMVTAAPPLENPFDFIDGNEDGGDGGGGCITDHAELYAASLTPTDYQSPTPAYLCSCPITCIKFDSAGVLFATGNSKGLVCIYDFDECMYHMQIKSQEAVTPVLKLHTNKTPGDIHFNCWGNNEEVTVAHSFSTDICIYDLPVVSAAASAAARQFINGHINSGFSGQVSVSTWENNASTATVAAPQHAAAATLNSSSSSSSSRPHHTPPLHLLSMPKGKKSGGHNCVLTLELEVQMPPMRAMDHIASGIANADGTGSASLKRLSRTRRCVIAGSSTGTIRMWYVDGAMGPGGMLRQSSFAVDPVPVPLPILSKPLPVTTISSGSSNKPHVSIRTNVSASTSSSSGMRKRPQEKEEEDEDELDMISSFSFKPQTRVPPPRPATVVASASSVRTDSIGNAGNAALRRHVTSNSSSNSNLAVGSQTPLYPKWEVCANPLLCLAGSTQVMSAPVVSLQHTLFSAVSLRDTRQGTNGRPFVEVPAVSWNRHSSTGNGAGSPNAMPTLVNNPTIVTAFNAAGVISMWDVSRLQSTSFGANQVPTWIACMELWDFPVSDTGTRSPDSSSNGSYGSNAGAYAAVAMYDAMLPHPETRTTTHLPQRLNLRQYLRQAGRLAQDPSQQLTVVGVTKVDSADPLLSERVHSGVLHYSVTLSDSTTALIDLNLRVVLQCTVSASCFEATASASSQPTNTTKDSVETPCSVSVAPRVTEIYGAGILRRDNHNDTEYFAGVGGDSCSDGARLLCRMPCAVMSTIGSKSGVVCVQDRENSIKIVSMVPSNAYHFTSHVPHSHSTLHAHSSLGSGMGFGHSMNFGGAANGNFSVGADSNCPAAYMLQAPSLVHLRTNGPHTPPKDFNFILPGYVVTIDQNNSFDLHTSVDLRSYLCAESQQSGTAVKSCVIRLEIEPNGIESYLDFNTRSTDRRRGTKSSHDNSLSKSLVYPLSNAGYNSSSTAVPYYTVVSITSNRITVNMPIDCEVTNGSPKVVLRTNLTAHCISNPGYTSTTAQRTSKSPSIQNSLSTVSIGDKLTVPRVLKTFTSSCPISCVAAHPSVPVVCVGMQDDTVQFIVADNAPK